MFWNGSPAYESRSLVRAPHFFFSLLQWAIFGLCRGQPAAAWAVFLGGYFARQAAEFAEQLNAPAMASRAFAKQGEIQIHMGHLPDAHSSLIEYLAWTLRQVRLINLGLLWSIRLGSKTLSGFCWDHH